MAKVFFLLLIIFITASIKAQSPNNSVMLEGLVLYPEITNNSKTSASTIPQYAFAFSYNFRIDLGKKFFLDLRPGYLSAKDFYYSGPQTGIHLRKYFYRGLYITTGINSRFNFTNLSGMLREDKADLIRACISGGLGYSISKKISFNINYYYPLDERYGYRYGHEYDYSTGVPRDAFVKRTFFLLKMFSLGLEISL